VALGKDTEFNAEQEQKQKLPNVVALGKDTEFNAEQS
jgi:hypothetical protein